MFFIFLSGISYSDQNGRYPSKIATESTQHSKTVSGTFNIILILILLASQMKHNQCSGVCGEWSIKLESQRSCDRRSIGLKEI